MMVFTKFNTNMIGSIHATVIILLLAISDKAGFLSNKKHDSYKCWTCAEFCEDFTFIRENIYVQSEGMVYQQKVGITMGTNCAPLIANLFLFCYERDFMSNLHKYKQYGLMDMFNNTSRCLDDIFIIDDSEFEKHIPGIYPTDLPPIWKQAHVQGLKKSRLTIREDEDQDRVSSEEV